MCRRNNTLGERKFTQRPNYKTRLFNSQITALICKLKVMNLYKLLIDLFINEKI